MAKNAYSIELDYKGADAAQAGSWGAYVAFRQLAPFASPVPTYNITGFNNSARGWEIGANYAFAKNIIGTAKYFIGKDDYAAHKFGNDGSKYTGVFTRLEFLF